MTLNCRIPLEKEAEIVCRNSSIPPLIFELPPPQARKVLEDAQNLEICMYPAEITSMAVGTESGGRIRVYFVRPKDGCTDKVILYIHGGGWVLGSFHTHEKLVREIAARTNAVVVFPEFTLSPEAKYPTALLECYEILCAIPKLASSICWTVNMERLIVAGDSAGGNMAAGITIMSKYRNGPEIQKQLLYYPVTNACFNTPSYCQFGVGYYLYRCGMKWFWDNYTTSMCDRNEITASPLRASSEELRGLPAAMILTGEADVLRDEGEDYAKKLRCAEVPVTAMRFEGIIHDFVMLNALNDTKACRMAMDVSTNWLNQEI